MAQHMSIDRPPANAATLSYLYPINVVTRDFKPRSSRKYSPARRPPTTKSCRMPGWKLQAVAGVVLFLFGVQLWFGILMAVPPDPTSPSPASVSSPTEYAFLNHTQIVEDDDGCWQIWANNCVSIVAEIGGPNVPWGGDQATFFFGEANCSEWDQTQYTVTTGLHTWSRTLDDEWKLYNLSIPAWSRNRFTSLSVQPIYIAQGMVNATRATPERVWFNASGEICVLAWSLGNFTDLALQLDGAVLKRNDYGIAMDYPCLLVADVVFQSDWLRFPARVPAGQHALDIWGSENESIYYAICLDTADSDGDLLTDAEEMMLGDPRLSPRWANPWGYAIAEPYTEPPLEEVIENPAPTGSWVQEVLTFYVPPGIGDEEQKLTIQTSGKFTNLSIDGDSSLLGNLTMYGYIGDGEDAVQVIPPSDSPTTCADGDLYAPDWVYGGTLMAGEWHTVSYKVYRSSLDLPQLALFVGDQQVAIIGSQSNSNPDDDGDGVPTSYDLSDSASLTWRKDSLLQLTVPCDRTAPEDVQIKIQVIRGANDPDPEKMLEWHASEEAGRQVRLTQVMIAYGPGSNAPSHGQLDYWNDLDDLTRFLNSTSPWPVDTYNLVGKDANGFSNTSALMGDCDPLPQSGSAAYDYQMILFPSLATRVAEYTLSYPSDHPAIRNDGTIVLRVRFAIAAVDQSRIDPNDLALLALYDYPSNLTLSGVQVSFLSNINGLLGQPRDAGTHLACWSYNMNPNIQMDWDPEIARAIVANFSGAHFMTQYHWNQFDNNTLSAIERLNYARNQTPWDGQSAEVTYITQTTRTLDLLSKINQSVRFDLLTGEQYCRYPQMFDFASIGIGRYLNPGTGLIPGWTCTAGMGQATIMRNIQTRAGVLELRPDTSSLTVHGDKGVANGTGQVSFAAYLDSTASSLEIRVGNGTSPESFALVAEGGFLSYRAADGSLSSLTEFWPREWFEFTLEFDNFDGTFDLFIDGAMQFAAVNLPSWHPWSEIQTEDVIVANGKSTLDGLELFWGDSDPSEVATQVCYESVHYGDVSDRASFYEVSDVYNGTYVPGDPELEGGELDLYSTYYTNLQHAMQRVKVQNWPLSLCLVRAGDTSLDDFQIDNFLNLTIGQGTFLPATWEPNSQSSPYSWSGRDAPDTVTFRNLLINEWANPPLAGVPATIVLSLGDDAHWEWDWRAGEVDPWAEFHARHTLPKGVIDVQAELAKRMQIIDEAVDYASKLIAKIIKGNIPEFEVVEYIEAPGGRSVINPSTLEQVNVGGFGAIPAGDAMYFVRKTFTRDDLLEACGEIIVAYNKLLEVIYAGKNSKLLLPRWVRINEIKLKEMYSGLYSQYFDQLTHKLGRIPQELVDQLPQDVLIIEEPNYGRTKTTKGQVSFEHHYAREVWVSVTRWDKINAIINAKRSCDLFHPRQVKNYKIMIDYAAKFLGIDPSDPVLGDPEQTRTFGGIEVTLPSVKPTMAERKKGYIYTSLGKLIGKKPREPGPLTFTTPEGEDKQFDILMIFFLESSPYYTGKWTAAWPFTYYDPQNYAAAMFFDSERFGGKLFYNFDTKLRNKLFQVYKQTGNPVFKAEYEQALQICKNLGNKVAGNINYGKISGKKGALKDLDNVLTDIGYLVNRNPWPLNPLAPQVAPGKIFQYGGELTYIQPIQTRKKETFYAYQWQEYTRNGLGRATTIKIPTVFQFPLYLDWKTGEWTGICRELLKRMDNYAPTEKELQLLQDAARKAQKNWKTCLNEADSILHHFLAVLVNITRWGGQANPEVLLKLACIAKNLIPLLEQALPKGPIRTSWIQSTGYVTKNIAAVIALVFGDFTGIGRGQVHKLFQIKKIYPTPFHDEREFVQFDLWSEFARYAPMRGSTGEFTEEEMAAMLEQQETGRIPGRVPGNPFPIPPAVQKILNEKSQRMRRLWNAYLDYLEENETRPQIPPSTVPGSRPPVTPAAPGALGTLDYFQRIGAALVFDAFIVSFLAESAGIAPGTPLATSIPTIGTSPVDSPQSIAVGGPSQYLLQVGASGGPIPNYVAPPAYSPQGYPYTPLPPASSERQVLEMMDAFSGDPAIQIGQPIPSGDIASFVRNIDDTIDYDAGGAGIVDAARAELAPLKSSQIGEIDSMELSSQATDNLWAMSKLMKICKVAIVLAVVSYVVQTVQLFEDYEGGAPVEQLVLDWAALGLMAVQIGIAVETVVILSQTSSIIAAGVTVSEALLTASYVTEFLSVLSSACVIISIVLLVIEYLIFTWQEFQQIAYSTLNTITPGIEARLAFGATTNASLVRNGGLHPGDEIGIQFNVTNGGYMEWGRSIDTYMNQYPPNTLFAGESFPRLSTGAPFWFHSRARAGSLVNCDGTWSDWAGPWAGDPVDWDTWGTTAQDFDPGDLVYPEMIWDQQIPDVVALADVITPRSDPVVYTNNITIPSATTSLAIQLEAQLDTTWAEENPGDEEPEHWGRTNLFNETATMIIGDTNGDGHIDRLYGEETLPVLESTLEGFLSACQNTTVPVASLDSLWANFTTATREYQWLDARAYLAQALALANSTVILPEGQLNGTLARLANFTGTLASQTWRSFQNSTWQSSPVPSPVVDNYYLLQTHNMTEWEALLGGAQGAALLNAGWRAAKPMYPVYGNLYSQDFANVGDFPNDWGRTSTDIHVDWRNSTVQDRRVLRIEENTSVSPQATFKDFGAPMLSGLLCITIEYAKLTQDVHFGLASAGSPLSYDYRGSWQDVAMLALKPDQSWAYIYYGGAESEPLYSLPLLWWSEITFIFNFDIVKGTVSVACPFWNRTFPLQRNLPVTQFRLYTGRSTWGVDDLDLWISYLSISNRDEQDAQLNGYWLTTLPGQIFIPKDWVIGTRQALDVLKLYPEVIARLPCMTNINGTLSWGDAVPVMEAGTSLSGAIHFTYKGTDNPVVNYELIAPPGWDVGYNPRLAPLKTMLNVPFVLEAPPGAPAGTYYLDFIERRADGGNLAGNVTFALRIPVRVRYNATWALEVAGLSDILAPGLSPTWGTLFNGGTAPQSLYITGEGIPFGWLTADGYAPIARWEFNGGTGGWTCVGTGVTTFEADRVDVMMMKGMINLNPDDVIYGSDFRASRYYDTTRQEWCLERTYFTVPAMAPTYFNPLSATLHEYIVGASGPAPSPLLIISPANGPITLDMLTWNSQPRFLPDQHAAECLANNLPPSGWVSFPGLAFGAPYAAWIEESGTAQVYGYGTNGGFRSYMLHAYNKVTSDDASLVLQSNVIEEITAAKNVSALVCPGDRVRVAYESSDAYGATLGAWESFALGGSGWQEREFIADGFYTLANLTISAVVGPGATFRVDSISLERSLTRNAPMAEFAFAGETDTPGRLGWSAMFGSGIPAMQVPVPVTNAAYVDADNPSTNYDTLELWVGNYTNGVSFHGTTFIEIPELTGRFSSFGPAMPPLLLTSQEDASQVQAFPCGAFNESTLTWATCPVVASTAGVNGSRWAGQPWGGAWAWNLTNFTSKFVCLNTSAIGWWVFPSDESPDDIRPRVVFTIAKCGVAGGALVAQSDQAESFRVSHGLAGGQNLTVRPGDRVWASFETTSSGGATLVLVNANPLGANLSFPLASAADQNRGTIYREFIIPAGGNYTAMAIDGMLGATQNFSLAFAGLYRYQPSGSPFANTSIGGFYNETISPGSFTQYTPVAGGTFSFDSTSDGFTGDQIRIANGSLVLAPQAIATVTATCALAGAGLVALQGTRARARYNSITATGSSIKFVTSAGNLTWVLPITSEDSWQEATFALPQCTITAVVAGGSFTPATNLSLDYLLLEVPAAGPCVLPEVANHRDVLALKNIAACGGVVGYTFPEPQSRGRIDFSIYAPGTNATLAITLEGANGAGIQLEIADWQLWLGNLSGSFAAATIYSGWHSLSIAWDCASHNYTAWYFNQTLVTANSTTGWGILNFVGSSITGIRIGMADARSTYYIDGIYLDPCLTPPTNQSLVEIFRAGTGIFVDLGPGEEWTLQLAAPPRSPITAPGTYPVHLAIYDASTGQLVGLVHKNITIPAFYDIGLTCDAPFQIHQVAPYGTGDGNFDFTGILTNLGNVEQTFTLSAPGLDPLTRGTFFIDTGVTWELAGTIALVPGESLAYKLEIRDAPAIACAFALQVESSNNVTFSSASFAYNAAPVIEGGQVQGTSIIEWQPAGKDLLFTAWDNTTSDPWYEAWWNAQSLGTGQWESGKAFNVSIDLLLAAGASILGSPQAIHVAVHDGYSLEPNILRYTLVVDDLLPVTISPPGVVTTWESPLNTITWICVDNGAWDPTTGWQDDFGDAVLGTQWMTPGAVENNGTLRLTGTQILAAAPLEDFAVVTRLAHVPVTSNPYGGAGITIPTDDQGNYIRCMAHPNDLAGTTWDIVEVRSSIGTTVYGPIAGRLTNLAIMTHGSGLMTTYDIWYCINDSKWTRIAVAQTSMSLGSPTQRRFGLFHFDAAGAEFDWVRCQTLRPAPGATYTVYRNGNALTSGGWAGFGSVTVPLEDLRPLGPHLVGDNKFTLVLTDPVGGTASSSAWVNISQVAPVLSQPPDYSGLEGDTPVLTWDVLDNYAVTPAYTIYLGMLGTAGFPIASGTWISGGIISSTMPPLGPGTYDCRLVTTNGISGASEDHVILTIMQSAFLPVPTVTSTALPSGENQEVIFETPALVLDVTLTTTEAVTLVTGAWEGNPVVGMPPELAAEGAYFSLEASNEAAIQFPLTMTVMFPYNSLYGWTEDDLAHWVGAYVYNEETLAWELVDGTVLAVRRFETLEGNFVEVALSITHFSIFAVGLWNLPPVVSSPANITYLGGSKGHTITWQITDETTLEPTYTITHDGVTLVTGTWPADNTISINVDGLTPGIHNYTLAADDGRFANVSDSVMVVVENFAPVLSAPPDIVYAWGTTGNTITWQVADDSIKNASFIILWDGAIVNSGALPDSNIITWNIDGLAVGAYWYHLEVNDGLTGIAEDDVHVTVLNTLPVISAPPDISYEYGNSGPTIAWTVADGTVLAGTYTVTLGGFPVAQGAWISGDTITWTPSDLIPGTWAATLTVDDGYGGVATDSCVVIITNAPPVLSGPHSAIFEAGNASAGVWVTITDPSAACDAAYSIFRDSTRVASGRWASGGSIYVALRFAPPGRHDMDIIAWDGLGGVATHSLLATTTNMAPMVSAPAPVTFEAGTANPILNWSITDESAENATYALAINGINFTNNTWASGDVVSLAVGSWMPGTYNATLAAADGWGAVTENGTTVVVTNTVPIVLAPPPIAYEAGDPRPVATFVVDDVSTRDPSYTAYLDGSQAASGNWASGVPITIPASGLAPGVYSLTLVAGDGYGAMAENNTAITVRPDDDTSCDIADLTCSVISGIVTVMLSLVDPSGYAGLNYFHVDGVTPSGLALAIVGTQATVTFPNTYGPGLHAVDFSLTDGDNDWPGDGAVGTFTCTFQNGPYVQPLLDLVDAGIAMVWASSDTDWRKPAANRQAEMVVKLSGLRAMLESGNYSDAYDVLLHDIKPKLTGLKTDKHEVPWGNGVFNNPWVTGTALQGQFRMWANNLLQEIEDWS